MRGIKYYTALCAVALSLGVVPAMASIANDLSVLPEKSSTKLLLQREQYSQALKALASGKTRNFLQLKDRLRDYPLYRYLDYAYFKSQVRSAKKSRADQFIGAYSDSFLSDYARSMWLHEMAREGRWEEYLHYYQGASTRRQNNTTHSCYATYAKLISKQLGYAEKLHLAKQKWLVGKSQPKACDPVMSWLKKQKAYNNELIWQRTELALDKRNWSLARTLARKLKGVRAKQHKTWVDVRRKPRIILQSSTSKTFLNHPQQHRKLSIYAVNRVLADDLVEAELLWAELQKRYTFSKEQAHKLSRRLAIRSAQRHYDDALRRLDALPKGAVNERVREWSVRAALRVQDWNGAYRSLLNMLPAEQVKPEWVYWRGRVEQKIGNGHVAKLAYERLAEKRGYYSFLAAERLGQPYAFTPEKLRANQLAIQVMSDQPAFRRVRELLLQEQLNYARVEWAGAIKGLSDESLLTAGHLAHQWQWHEQAIRIAAKLGRYDDLDLRFAMPYRQAVEQHAKAVKIDPNWAQAIMRRESAYAADARSGVGARGLMQLMPATAKHVAKKQGWKWRGVGKLNNPEVNIRYGTAYLAELSAQLDNEIPLVSAAYNAGPHRVAKWRPKTGVELPMDIWIDTIPFKETRKYVHAVSEYMSIFKWRAEGQPDQPEQNLMYTQKQVGDGLLASSAR